MPETTAFVVAGQSLHHVKSVCGLAKLYSPSLVILEDVDLVFTEREINPHVSALGDLMDEMDGFRPDEAVSFILTTNAIDRVERAIKDRPGRIGQCVYFGPPDAELRRRYLVQYLQPFDAAAVDPAKLAADAWGCSQAFLKEWIARAALFALEDDARRDGRTDLQRRPQRGDRGLRRRGGAVRGRPDPPHPERSPRATPPHPAAGRRAHRPHRRTNRHGDFPPRRAGTAGAGAPEGGM